MVFNKTIGVSNYHGPDYILFLFVLPIIIYVILKLFNDQGNMEINEDKINNLTFR